MHQQFQKELREKINNYFNDTNQKKRGGSSSIYKTFIIILMLVASYSFMLIIGSTNVFILLLLIIMTLALQLMGSFAVMHDASHGSISNKKWINTWITHFLLSISGVSAQIWKYKHVLGHHIHTNIHNKDADIDGHPFLLFSPYDKKYKFHHFQYIYAPLLYCLLTIKWIIYDDCKNLILNTYHLNTKKRLLCFIDILSSRFIYMMLSLVIPTMLISSFSKVIVVWFIYNAIYGFCSTIIFQCAHVNTKTTFTRENDKSNHTCFSIRQLRSTCDFATKNKIFTWVIGGLNYQSVHHLFPAIHHTHYPAIQRILVDLVNKYPSIDYNEFLLFFLHLRTTFLF